MRPGSYIKRVRRQLFWGSSLFAALLAASCRDGAAQGGPPRRDCALTVWHRAASAAAHVEVVADWDGWARPGRALEASRTDGWRVASFAPPPGEHAYAIVEDGAWLVDANVATSAFHDGQEVSWVQVDDCEAPALRVDDAHGSPDGAATIAATFLASGSGDAVDPSSVRLLERDGSPVAAGAVAARTVDPARGAVSLTLAGLAPGKHTFLLSAADVRGRATAAERVTAWIEAAPFDLRDSIVYQVMVDRFRDASGAVPQPAVASARAGGTVDGVRAAIESGELAALGVNTVWLSPLYANPDGMFPGSDGHAYSSYHGYWPIDSRALDARVATEASLDALVAAAHGRGMRVMFDVVPNHVHQQHPYVTEHAHDGWFNNPGGSCICGGTCDWSTHIQDCWFAPYLPDLDWRNPAVADRITDDVVWWLDRFDGDGLRIDAVPMMPRAATRRIAAAVRARHDHPGHQTYLLGENFTGPYGFTLLQYELGPFGLDGEFHFPLMWSLRAALAEGRGSMADVDDAIHRGETTWSGAGAIMATMIGNHDVARFASDSAGDAGGDPWTPAVMPPDGSDVYAKQAAALGAVLTLPGAPVIYYGDEVAQVGHYDPDSRRVMPAEAALTPAQRATRETVRALGRARACSPALRRGTYRTLFTDAEHLVFARELPASAGEGGGQAAAETVVVVLTRAGGAPLSIPLDGVPAGDYVDAVTGRTTSLRAELTILQSAPLSLQLLFPKGSDCVNSAFR